MLELWLAAAVLVFVPTAYLPWALLAVAIIGFPGLKARWGGAPYVPTIGKTADSMFRLGDIRPGEHFIDLGCGDGRLVRRAASVGAIATGIEASFLTFLVAWFWSLGTRTARIRFGDLWKTDCRHADVIFCYLLVASMERFEREIWPTLKPGARVVSHAFKMRDVAPVATEEGVYLYRKG